MLTDLIGHIFNLIYIIGFIVKNMIWLRIVMIIGAVFEILYFVMIGDEQLWVSLFWCTVWILVNSIQLYFLLKEKILLKFNEKELLIYNLSFSILEKINFRKLLDISESITFEKDKILIEDSYELDKLIFITSGIAKVEFQDNSSTFLTDGNFVGEMSFITKELTTAKVVAVTNVECLVWQRERLEKLFVKYKEIEEGLNSIFNHDLVKKLAKMKVKKLVLNDEF